MRVISHSRTTLIAKIIGFGTDNSLKIRETSLHYQKRSPFAPIRYRWMLTHYVWLQIHKEVYWFQQDSAFSQTPHQTISFYKIPT